MSCSLCLQDKPLRRSHIVPEFMHRDMYDRKHRFFGLSSSPSTPVKLFQKGLRERLLCGDCEQQLGKYEHYASDVFYARTLNGTPIQNGIVFRGLDYKSLKLFFVSILWRFGITSLEYFRGAKLGPHVERLRKLIHAEDPGDFLAYPCLMAAVMIDRKHVSDLIVPPGRAKVEAQSVWSLVVGGFLLSFFVGNHAPPSTLHPAFLQLDGTLVLQIREMKDIDFLHRLTCEMAVAQRERRRKQVSA